MALCTCLLHKNVEMQLATPNLSIATLAMKVTCIRALTLRDASYMVRETCGSIGLRFPPEKAIPVTKTFAEKVIRNFECNIEQKENINMFYYICYIYLFVIYIQPVGSMAKLEMVRPEEHVRKITCVKLMEDVNQVIVPTIDQ